MVRSRRPARRRAGGGLPALSRPSRASCDDARATRAMLDAARLAAPSGHVAARRRCASARTGRVEIGEDARHRASLIVPALHGRATRPTDAAGWRAVGAELGRHGRAAARKGLRLRLAQPRLGVPEAARRLAAARTCSWTRGAADARLGGRPRLAGARRRRPGGLARALPRPARRASTSRTSPPPARNEDEDGWAESATACSTGPDLWRRSAAGGARWMVVEHDKPERPARFARRSPRHLPAAGRGAGR